MDEERRTHLAHGERHTRVSFDYGECGLIEAPTIHPDTPLHVPRLCIVRPKPGDADQRLRLNFHDALGRKVTVRLSFDAACDLASALEYEAYLYDLG